MKFLTTLLFCSFVSLYSSAQKKPVIDSIDLKDFPIGDFPKPPKEYRRIPNIKLSDDISPKEQLLIIDNKIFRGDDENIKKYKFTELNLIQRIHDRTSSSGIKSVTVYSTRNIK